MRKPGIMVSSGSCVPAIETYITGMAGAILGIKQWQNAGDPPMLDTSSISKTNLFVQGIVVTIPNPKSLIFIAAFLPQFIDTAHPIGLQLAFIVPTFLVITFTVTSVWAFVAGRVRIFLQSQRAFQSVLRTAGGLMIIAGVGLGLSRR